MGTQIRAFQIDPSVFALVGATFQQEADANLDIGRAVRQTGNGVVGLASNASETQAGAIGVTAAAISVGLQGPIQYAAVLDVEMELGLTLLFGDVVYVGTSGKGTNVQSVTPGDANCRIGHVSDSSAYNPVGSAPQFAKIALNIDYPIVVA